MPGGAKKMYEWSTTGGFELITREAAKYAVNWGALTIQN